MATVKLLYRSKRNQAELKIRLLFSTTKNHVIETGSKIIIDRDIFDKYENNTKTRDIDIRNKIDELSAKISTLRKYILSQYKNLNKEEIDKTWLNNTVRRFYETQKVVKTDIHDKPQSLVHWCDKYISYKRNQVTEPTIRKSKVIKNYLVRYENDKGVSVYVSDVSIDFIESFKNFMIDDEYSISTINRAVKFIKTVCKHASVNGIVLNNSFQAIKLLKRKSKPIIFLKISEIESITKLKLNGYDDIIRDWLIIGYNTGQRFSDFIEFRPEYIRKQEGQFLIDFRQQKGAKLISIPLNKSCIKILEKNNWSFPKAITNQFFNERIKIICRKAKIKDMTYGTLKMKVDDGKSRGVSGMYPKHKLIGSHTCRRSFASNNFGKMPTGFIRMITGHTSEKSLLEYIGKSESDIAIELAKYLD